MKISVVGENLTAVVTACCLAELGNEIYLLQGSHHSKKTKLKDRRDICEESTKMQFERKFIVEEPLLQILMDLMIEKKFLSFKKNKSDIFTLSTLCFIALEDESEILTVIKQLIKVNVADATKTIILQCSHSVGFGDQVQQLIDENGMDSMDVVIFPSFIKAGTALTDFRRPDRMILGFDKNTNVDSLHAVLNPFSLRENLFVYMRRREAEFTRLAVNSLLASRLSLVNEMANAAEQLDVDINSVRLGLGKDKRIGPHYLYPGCGYGGENIGRHIEEFAKLLSAKGADPSLLEAAIKSNQAQKELLFRKLWKLFKSDIKGKTIAIWGTAFKPGTSSVENATSIIMARTIISQGALIRAYDPMANNAFKAVIAHENLSICENALDATVNADVLIILTEWKEFFSPDFEIIKNNLNFPIIMDGRNIYDPSTMKKMGFDYYGIGRGTKIEE